MMGGEPPEMSATMKMSGIVRHFVEQMDADLVVSVMESWMVACGTSDLDGHSPEDREILKKHMEAGKSIGELPDHLKMEAVVLHGEHKNGSKVLVRLPILRDEHGTISFDKCEQTHITKGDDIKTGGVLGDWWTDKEIPGFTTHATAVDARLSAVWDYEPYLPQEESNLDKDFLSKIL